MKSKILLLTLSFFSVFSSYSQNTDEIFKQVFKGQTQRWVPVNVLLDERDIGELSVKFVNNRPVAFLNLQSFLSPYLSNPEMIPDGEITMDDLESTGIQLSLDEEKFVILIHLDNEIKKEEVTNFSSDYRPKWVKEESKSSDFSFFSNFFYYLPYNKVENNSAPSELDILPNLQFYEFILESSHTYKEDEVERKYTRVIYDHTPSATRTIVGDNSGPSSEFLSPVQFLGASFGTDFTLRPYDVTVPRGEAEFELTEASTVKVYINGSLLQILRLRAGKHNLEDLPLIQGLNEVKLVIESELGRIDEIIIPASFSQDLLEKGLSDFYYGVGKKSENSVTDLDYLDDESIFTALHRYGFTKNFTLGGFFQGDNKSQLLGSDQVFSNTLGQFKTQFAGSTFSGRNGTKLKGEYYYLNRGNKGETATGHLLGIGWTSPDYKLVAEDNPLGYQQTTGSYSFNTTVNRINIRFGGDYEWNKKLRDTWNLNAGLGHSFTRRFNINVNSNYRNTISESSTFDFSIYFNWFLQDSGHNVYGNYDSTGNNSQVSLQKLQNSSHDQLSYQVTGRNDEVGSSLEVDANYNHHRIETGLRHTQTKNNGEDWKSYNGRLKLASAIGIVGGKFSVGRPVTDGFAIITRDDLIEKQDIKINKVLDEYSYESDLFNTIMISKLQAYRYYHLRIDPAFLDDGISLAKEEFTIFPKYKSGVLLSLEGNGAISFYAKLILPDGSNPSLETFEVIKDGKIVNRSFSNRKGRIVLEGLDASKYVIRLSTNENIYEAMADLSNSSFGLINLGEIKLKKVNK